MSGEQHNEERPMNGDDLWHVSYGATLRYEHRDGRSGIGTLLVVWGHDDLIADVETTDDVISLCPAVGDKLWHSYVPAGVLPSGADHDR